MLSRIAHFIGKRPWLHSLALSLWRSFPPRLAGFLKGQMARNWLVGAVAVMIDDASQPAEVLIVEHSYRRKGAWGLPGGALDSIDGDPTAPGQAASPDDVIEAALRREVAEELGIEIEVTRMLRVDAVPYIEEEPGPYRLDFYYLCRPARGFDALRADLASGKINPASPEIKQIRMVALPDLSNYDLFSPDVRLLHDDLPRLEPELQFRTRS